MTPLDTRLHSLAEVTSLHQAVVDARAKDSESGREFFVEMVNQTMSVRDDRWPEGSDPDSRVPRTSSSRLRLVPVIHRSVERIIDSVLDDLAGLTARHLFELSHGEAGWRHAWSLLDVAD